MNRRPSSRGKYDTANGQPAPEKARKLGAPPAGPISQPVELIEMHDAIKMLKTSRPTFYRWVRTGRIKGMKVGRQWRFERSEIERFLKGEEPRIELPAKLTPLLKALQERADQLGMKAVPRSETNEVRHAVSLMIRIGVAMRVTDISLAPYVKTEGGPPVAVLSFRVDGVVNRLAEFDVRLLQPLLDYWKSMAGCNIQERLRPQDGRILLKLADTQRNLDLRVCFLPAVLGESLTARVLDASAVRLDLEAMGYTPRDKQMLLRSLRAAWGVIFVTGPTGCGKTTLLYSCLKYLAAPEIKLITVEEPVEFFIPHVIQTQLRPSVGVTFAAALRAVLRSDPDVVLVGEIRDLETLQVVHQTASTGHLVLTTLHTEDAPSALTRMIDIGSDPFLVGDSVKLIIAQRLIRNLCPHCSVERTPPPPSLHEAGKMARSGGLDWNSLPKRFREPVGCAKCNKFGYRGRDVIAEALEVTPEIAAALRRLAKTEELRAIAVTQGMTTIAADGIRRAAAGHTTIAEVFRAVGVR